MSHVWVSQDWIASLGLAQYSRTFEEQLIDGRLLNVLTKKDLYKYLKIHKKFHQMSIAYGVELLRSLDFDKDVSGMFSHLNFVSKFRLIRGTEIASCNVCFIELRSCYLQYRQNVPLVLHACIFFLAMLPLLGFYLVPRLLAWLLLYCKKQVLGVFSWNLWVSGLF